MLPKPDFGVGSSHGNRHRDRGHMGNAEPSAVRAARFMPRARQAADPRGHGWIVRDLPTRRRLARPSAAPRIGPGVDPAPRRAVSAGCIEATPVVWKGVIYLGTRSGFFFAIGDK